MAGVYSMAGTGQKDTIIIGKKWSYLISFVEYVL